MISKAEAGSREGIELDLIKNYSVFRNVFLIKRGFMMTWKTRIEDINLDTLPFANDILLYLDDTQISVTGPARFASVDLSKVVGTTHIDYAGRSWGQLKPIEGTSKGDFVNNMKISCQQLKRAIANVRCLESNPEYYFSTCEKDYWSFYEIEGNFYISQGNHRTVIGRFFLHYNDKEQIVHGVKVTTAAKKNDFQEAQNRPDIVSRIFRWVKNL